MKTRAVLLFGTLSANLMIAAVVYFLSDGKSVAETWYEIDANSLVGLQALVEQRLDPDPEDPTLYFDVVLPVIETPAWLAVLVLLMVLDALPLALLLRAARRRAAAGATTVERSE